MNSQDYDAIVIGSGAGGAAAAFRLVMGGLNVALLEKGNHLPTDGSTLDIQRVVHEGAFLSREPWTDGRGRGLAPEEHFNVGGKTKWYGAALLRFGQHEFLAEPAHQCAGWPLTLPDLEPYYTEAEKLLGVRLFEREPDLARILGKLALPGSEWQAQAIPLALAADITAHRSRALRRLCVRRTAEGRGRRLDTLAPKRPAQFHAGCEHRSARTRWISR